MKAYVTGTVRIDYSPQDVYNALIAYAKCNNIQVPEHFSESFLKVNSVTVSGASIRFDNVSCMSK